MFISDVLNVAQPVIRQANPLAADHRADAAAAVMADNEDVLHLEQIDRQLDDRKAIQIRVDDHVGEVAVHEHFAGQNANDFVGGDATIGAADPEEFRVLLTRKLPKKLRISLLDRVGPSFVLFEELFQMVHAGAVAHLGMKDILGNPRDR